MSSFIELQKALRTRVHDAINVPTFDHVPENQPPPFAVIGNDYGSPYDTKTFNGVSHSIEVHLYSGKRTLEEVKTFIDALYADLQRSPFTVIGCTARPPQYDFSQAFIEPDGARGVLRFVIVTTEL